MIKGTLVMSEKPLLYIIIYILFNMISFFFCFYICNDAKIKLSCVVFGLISEEPRR